MNLQPVDIINILSDPRYAPVLLAVIVWVLIWKGIALWRAAGNKQKKWFVVLLILNTFGILEIIYIFYFSKPKKLPENPQNLTQ